MGTSTLPKIIIEGLTTEGKKFRPNDWADRLCGALSTFKQHRIYYSPLLRPSHRQGHRCVIVDQQLKTTHPELFKQVLEFAEQNHLVISELEDNHG